MDATEIKQRYGLACASRDAREITFQKKVNEIAVEDAKRAFDEARRDLRERRREAKQNEIRCTKQAAVVPAALGFPGGVRAPLGRVPAGSALRYEVQLLRCLTGDASTEQGFAEDEKICCSDENFPCDPKIAARGGVSVPEGFRH